MLLHNILNEKYFPDLFEVKKEIHKLRIVDYKVLNLNKVQKI